MTAHAQTLLDSRPGRAAMLGATGLLALGLGTTFAAFSAPFEEAAPAVLLGIALAPILVLAVLAAPVVGVLAVLATFPIGSLGAPVGPVTLQSVEAAVLVLATLVVLRRISIGLKPLPWAPPLWWAAALVAWTVVGMNSAVDTGLAIKQLAQLVGGLAFAVGVLGACRTARDVRLVLAGFVAVSAGIAFLAALAGANFETEYGGSVVGGRLQGAFDHPNQLGSLCALAAPVAAGLALGGRTRLGRLAAGTATLPILAGLMLSLSRGAWVGEALAALLLLVLLPEARRALLVAVLPLVVVAAFTWKLAPPPPELKVVGERARALTVLSPYDGRRQIYDEAEREIRDDPLTGQGPGGFPVASVRAASEASTISAHHAHNLLLTWAAEAGLPAAAIILGFAASLGLAAHRASREARRRGDLRDRALVLGVAAGLLALFGQGAFDYTLRNADVHVATWGLIGALLACSRVLGRT